MYGMFASIWPEILGKPADDRDRIEGIVLYDARLAGERPTADVSRTGSNVLERVRRAFGPAPAEPECVTCPA